MAAPSTFAVADMNPVFGPAFEQPKSESLEDFDSISKFSPILYTATSIDSIVIDSAILRDEYLKAARELLPVQETSSGTF